MNAHAQAVADATRAVVDAARGVRYKHAALRQALRELDAAQAAYSEKVLRDAACTHPNAARKAGSNTGGYDGPSFDRYWYDYTCPDCGKTWTVPQ